MHGSSMLFSHPRRTRWPRVLELHSHYLLPATDKKSQTQPGVSTERDNPEAVPGSINLNSNCPVQEEPPHCIPAPTAPWASPTSHNRAQKSRVLTCTTAGGVPGWRRGAAALEGRGGRGRRRRRETPQGARRLPVQGVVSLRQLRGRLGDGAGRAVGDAGGLPVRGRWGGEGLALSPRPRSDTDWGGRGLDRWRGGGSIPAGRRSLSRGGRQGLLPVVGGDLGAVCRRGGGRRGGTAARWGRRRGGRAVLHAGATSGAGPGEVRQGWPLCARQLRRRGSAVVRIILRSAVAGRHRGPGGSGSGAGDLQGLLPRAVCGEGKRSEPPGTARDGAAPARGSLPALRRGPDRGECCLAQAGSWHCAQPHAAPLSPPAALLEGRLPQKTAARSVQQRTQHCEEGGVLGMPWHREHRSSAATRGWQCGGPAANQLSVPRKHGRSSTLSCSGISLGALH